MKKFIVAVFALSVLTSCISTGDCLQIINDSAIDRVNEVVEISIDNADEYVVYNLEGDALQCQTTYDGKLLFEASVAANSSTEYRLCKGRRIALDTVATGKVYPQWYDDFGWENDKIGFRAYSVKMEEKGDKLYGYDIFTKRHHMPVLDILYGTNFDSEYEKVHSRLSKKNTKAAQQLVAATTYHIDHGLGMDYYAVGPTLGCGTAALICNGEIKYPGFYKKCEILDKGGLRFTFRLTYAPVEVDGKSIQEVRTITLDKGSHFNHVVVEYQNLSEPTDIAIGLAMHDMGKKFVLNDDYVAYAEPKHNFGWQIYNAVIYPDQKNAKMTLFDKPKGTAKGHLISYGRYNSESKLDYYMGAGWNRWGFKSAEDWFDYVAKQAQSLKQPLKYKY